MPAATSVPPPWDRWQCGKIIGFVDLLACIPNKDGRGRYRNPDDVMQDIEATQYQLDNPDSLVLSEQVLSDIQYRDFSHFWVFGNPAILDEPVPYTGSRRIWDAYL